MKYKLSLARDISRLCYNCVGYLILFSTMLYVYQESIPEPYWLLGIPFILLCFHLIQYYCFQGTIYVILHGIVWIPFFLLPFSYREYFYLYLFMLLVESIRSIHTWKTSNSPYYNDIPWFLFTCIFLIYTIATANHIGWFSALIYYLGIGILLLHFIRLFITGLSRLVTQSEHAKTMPAKKIMVTNSFIFLFFVILLIIATVLLQYSNIDNIFATLGNYFLKIVRFVIHAIIYITTIITTLLAKNIKLDNTQNAHQNMEESFTALQEPSLIAQILDGFFTLATMFVLSYIAYCGIVSLIHTFTTRYTLDTDVVVQLKKPTENIQATHKKTSFIKRIQEFFQNDNASKVRRGWLLKIKSYKPVIYKIQDTPTEIATKIEENYQDDIHELTIVYEKARYSNEEITFDDVQKGGLL